MNSMSLWVLTFILVVGVADDLRSRKIHNPLILGLAALALVYTIWTGGWPGLQSGLLGMVTAIFACLPLVLTRTVGAGDLKLLAVFGLASNWATVLSVLVLSIIWGALLGLIQSIVSGQFKQLLRSTADIALRRKPAAEMLHRIPYSVALLFGWLCHVTLARLPGVSLW